MEWKQGTYVWAKTNSRYWPAVVVNAIDGTMQKPKEGFVCVFWFGDNRISMVSVKCLLPFCTHFKDKYKLHKKAMGKKWQHGILTAIKEFGRPVTVGMDDEELLDFAENNFANCDKSLNVDQDLPEYIRNEINTKKYVEWRRKNLCKNNERIRNISNADDLQTAICISCYCQKPKNDHPIFHAKICTDCTDKLRATLCVLDDEGCYIFCMICSNSSNLTTCSNGLCKRKYCKSCTKNLFGIANFPVNGKFVCILCTNDKTSNKLMKIKKRKSWIFQLQTFLSGNIEVVRLNPVLDENWKILMYFCGSSVGLDQACPFDENLIHLNGNEEFLGFSNLSDFAGQYNSTNLLKLSLQDDQEINAIVLLDKSKFLNANNLLEIGHLDLIVGGTSHDPITAHTFEENATIVIFYEFYRILQIYRWINSSSKFFWLFETSCFIPMDHRNVISRYLEIDPILIHENDAVRLVWTNLPQIKLGNL